jgi:hypothetical protein
MRMEDEWIFSYRRAATKVIPPSVCLQFVLLYEIWETIIPNSLFLRENIPQFSLDLTEFTAAFPRFSFSQKGVFTANLRL